MTDLRALLPLFYVMTPTVCWSPDGRWLAVAQLGPDETHGVFLVPVESGEARRLISNPVAAGRFYWPVLSPKGDFLAYSQCTGSRACDLYVLELGTGYVPKGEPRRLTRRGAVIEGIAWTPDDRSLIYTAVPDLGSGFSMWRISVSGNAEPERLELTGDRALHPALSRDGKRLAYSRYEWDSDIWKLEAGVPPQRFISSTRTDFQPEFSPDGRRIAFATDRSGAGTELWVAERDGTNLVRLVKGWGGLLGDPDWSPDGRWITFHAQGEDADWNIYVIDAAGGQPRRLTLERTEDQRPTWSRDGRSVYFCSNRSGRYEVYRIPRQGGDWTQITKNGGSTPIESSDGKILYYERGGNLIARQLATGEEREVLGALSLAAWVVFDDGVYHIVRHGRMGSPGFDVRFLNFVTGKDEVLHQSELIQNYGLTVSPDRKTVLVAAAAAGNSDLMLVENFR